MKPSEIESFLSANKDLFGPGLGEQAVIDTDDIHELFRRLFKSQEFKRSFIEINCVHEDTDKYYGKY